MGDQADAPPVSVEEFAARLDDLNVRGAFAIAVSGGRDSMALARLAAVFAARKKVRVLALTVDHGLRQESAQEAEQAAAWCKAAGLTHCILTWEGAKPSSGIQEAARHARYKLLAQAVEEAGLATLLTAHSADDQAETVFMRLARGAGAAGLSGMSAARLIAAGAGAPIRLVRPFLTASRNRLTAAVEGFRQPYIDDPGNDDPAFERIRARALLAALEQQSILTRDALLRTASAMQQAARDARAREGALLKTLGGVFYRWGGVSLDRRRCAEAPSLDTQPLCRRLVYAVGGGAFPPEAEAARDAWERALQSGAATLGGALIKAREDRLWFLREPGALCGRTGKPAAAPTPLRAGEKTLWDRRFIISAGPAAEPLDIAPIGDAPPPPAVEAAFARAPTAALQGAPGLFRRGALIGTPAALSLRPEAVTALSLVRERFETEIVRFS